MPPKTGPLVTPFSASFPHLPALINACAARARETNIPFFGLAVSSSFFRACQYRSQSIGRSIVNHSCDRHLA
jgi:hypothetical protein